MKRKGAKCLFEDKCSVQNKDEEDSDSNDDNTVSSTSADKDSLLTMIL